MNIILNSLVPSHLATHYLAFRQFKGYLRHHGMLDRVNCLLHMSLVNAPPGETADAILAQDPAMVCFSVHLWNEDVTRAVCRTIKEKSPHVLTVLGGPCSEFLADEIRPSGAVDIVVRGAGEEVLRQLVARQLEGDKRLQDIPGLLYLGENGARVETAANPGIDIAKLTYKLDIEDGTDDVIMYEISRGCPFSCRYCAWSSDGGRTVRFYRRSKIETDLNAIFELQHLQYLGFCDSNIFLDKDLGLWALRHIRALNRQRRERGWKEINIIAEVNPELLDDACIDHIAQCPTGDMFSCGLQTIDARVHRESLNRKFDQETHLARLRTLNAKAWGLLNVEIIFGLPGETYEGFMRTVDFVISDLRARRFTAFHFLVIPGSYFRKHADELNLIYNPRPPYHLIRSDTFSEADVERARRFVFFMYMFYYMLKEIRALVEQRAGSSPRAAYERIIRHIAEQHPRFMDTYYLAYDEPNFTPVFEKYFAEIMAIKPELLSEIERLLETPESTGTHTT